ncbi:unnamed protein product [Adineta steineri]|uniref:Uncharacterized protein n=1 Tax=Adineta steineri TaxID=433720 RepID=A0A818RTZ9_9BILA|nr:unnamed protein product [Adineta steineri]CAF3658568.1 unnamed protein product [Adineta steineri]
MLATSHCTDRYNKPRIYEDYSTDIHNNKISWLNFLTAQPIPEETEMSDYSDSESSISSTEDSYIVLEVRKPRSIDKTTNIIENKLHFAQINIDEHIVKYDQIAKPITTRVPLQAHAIEIQVESLIQIDVFEKVIQRTNRILFHTPKKLDKSVSASDNDFTDSMELQTNCPIIEEEPMDINSSLTSLDSIDKDLLIENNYYPVLTQQKANYIEEEQKTPINEIKTLKRRLAPNDEYKEKSNRIKEQKIAHTQMSNSFSITNKQSKSSTLFRFIKNQTRHIQTKYNMSNHEMKSNEPSLVQIKYFDGRSSLIDMNIQGSQILCNPVSPLSSSSKFSSRKRILNHFSIFSKTTSTEQLYSKPKFGIFNGRKSKDIYV